MSGSMLSPESATVEFTRLGCRVSSHFHTGPIRDWPTVKAVVEVLGEDREKFPTRRVLEALAELFSSVHAIAAGLEAGPVIYFALPIVAHDAIGATGRAEDGGGDRLVSAREHQELAEVIMDTMADVGAWVSVRYNTVAGTPPERDPHTVRACWL